MNGAIVGAVAAAVVKQAMPPLKNPRRELFCQRIATSPKNGLSQGQCYEASGFKTNGRSADACAARLLTEANVQNRISELLEPAVRKTRATVDTLAAQFDAVFDGAMGSAQFGPAGNAAGLKAKLLGFMRERLEVGGVGEFDQCQSTDQVIETLLSRHESPAEALEELDELREMVASYAASHAIMIAPAAPARRPNETALSLAHSLPKRRRR